MNVLFLVSYTYYEQKMSRDRFQQMAAVGRQAGASTMVWGKVSRTMTTTHRYTTTSSVSSVRQPLISCMYTNPQITRESLPVQFLSQSVTTKHGTIRRPSKRCSGMTFGSSSSIMPTTWLSSRGVGHSVTDASSYIFHTALSEQFLSRLPGHGRIGRCRYCSRAL